MTNPNIEHAARVIAAAFVHGSSPDVALEVAQALDDARLLVDQTDPFRTPGRNRPAPSPAAIATLDRCGRAKIAANLGRKDVAAMPGEPEVSAAGGEVTFVVHPRDLDAWRTWLDAFGLNGSTDVTLTSVSAIARCTYRGMPTRLVGIGVPAMVACELRRTAAAK